MSGETKKIEELKAPISTAMLSEWLEWHRLRDKDIAERKSISYPIGIEEEAQNARSDLNALLHFVDVLIKAENDRTMRNQ